VQPADRSSLERPGIVAADIVWRFVAPEQSAPIDR
jgi:hypothetical protein